MNREQLKEKLREEIKSEIGKLGYEAGLGKKSKKWRRNLGRYAATRRWHPEKLRDEDIKLS